MRTLIVCVARLSGYSGAAAALLLLVASPVFSAQGTESVKAPANPAATTPGATGAGRGPVPSTSGPQKGNPKLVNSCAGGRSSPDQPCFWYEVVPPQSKTANQKAPPRPVPPRPPAKFTVPGADEWRFPSEWSEVRPRQDRVIRDPGGPPTTVRERSDGWTIVRNRLGDGYIQRPYSYRWRELAYRTYYYDGRTYGRSYQPSWYGGVALNIYLPAAYYAPGFYSWVSSPWVAPVAYTWGWAGNPWYEYYAGYFTPNPVYANPSEWLTDYLVAQTLQSAYRGRTAEPAAAQPGFIPMDPAVKLAIANEVRRQIESESSEARSAEGPMSNPGPKGIAGMLGTDTPAGIFVVGTGLYAPTDAGECALSEGDVLQVNPGKPADATGANLLVLASKGRDCPVHSAVTVGFAELQEMHNQMREILDQGLADLQREQGRNGIPAVPAGAGAPPVEMAFAASAPPPDPTVAVELARQAKDADRPERELPAAAGSTYRRVPRFAPVSSNGACPGRPDRKKVIAIEQFSWRTEGLRAVWIDGDAPWPWIGSSMTRLAAKRISEGSAFQIALTGFLREERLLRTFPPTYKVTAPPDATLSATIVTFGRELKPASAQGSAGAGKGKQVVAVAYRLVDAETLAVIAEGVARGESIQESETPERVAFGGAGDAFDGAHFAGSITGEAAADCMRNLTAALAASAPRIRSRDWDLDTRISAVNDNQLRIPRGLCDGVREGDRFEVSRIGNRRSMVHFTQYQLEKIGELTIQIVHDRDAIGVFQGTEIAWAGDAAFKLPKPLPITPR